MIFENIFELPRYSLLPTTSLSRVQRADEHHRGARAGSLNVAVPGSRLGRFDLLTQATAYFALRPDTACFEAVCRRESLAMSLAQAATRELLAFSVQAPMTLLDLRGEAEGWPVLQSLRFDHTQAIADWAYGEGLDGILYCSAQQPGGLCCALFGKSLQWLEVQSRAGLINTKNCLHPDFAEAIKRSCIPVVP